MDDRENLDEWADELLERHRSPGARRARALPDLDPDLAARLRASQRVHQRMVKAEAIFTIVGVVLLFVFGLAFYEGF
jgi:hypothetical protein